MNIYFRPSVTLPGGTPLTYEFDGDVITTHYGDETDSFDFTNLPDGSMHFVDIETTLSTHPIITVRKISGILYVELLNHISEDATEFEKFPNWIEVGVDNGTI